PALLIIGRTKTGSVIDQNIDPAECGRSVFDIARDRGFVGKVADGGICGATVPGDLLARFDEPFGAAGTDRNGGTGLGEGKRNRVADAAAAAGDDRALAGKIDVHVSS